MFSQSDSTSRIVILQYLKPPSKTKRYSQQCYFYRNYSFLNHGQRKELQKHFYSGIQYVMKDQQLMAIVLIQFNIKYLIRNYDLHCNYNFDHRVHPPCRNMQTGLKYRRKYPQITSFKTYILPTIIYLLYQLFHFQIFAK